MQEELFKEPKTNFCEMATLSLLRGRGWEIERNGFPDYMAVKEGRVIGVEVKPEGVKLRKSQRKMQKIFRLIGVPFKVFWVKGNGEILKSPESD